MPNVRRVVTGHNAKGKSVVLFDSQAPHVFGPVTEMWATDATPADIRSDKDAADRPFQMDPPPSGSIFRYVELPPESAASPEELEEATASMFAAVGAEHTRVDTTRHPGMHTTRSVDYVVVLSGKLTMLLDEGEVELEPFDVVVQRGTNHVWVNRGQEPARVVSVLIDAEPF